MSCSCMGKQEEKYYIYDLESGMQIQVTKEQREAYMRAWADARPSLDNDQKAKVLVVSTAGDMNEGFDYSQFFLPII